MNSVSQLTVIEEHPIPIDEGRAEHFQNSNPMFEDKDDILHPDELHERYKEVFAENDEWWECPKCGGETKIVRTEQATRACLECDWSVKIRIPESFKP